MTKFSVKRCPFCGKVGRLSAEHPYGRWARPYVRMDRKKFMHRTARRETGFEWEVRRIYGTDPLRQSIQSACVACNTGWMSRLQTAASPLILPFIKGQFPALSEEDRQKAAAWSIMVTMNLEYYDRDTIVTTEASRHELRTTEKPVPNWYVGLGKYSGEQFRSYYYRREFDIYESGSEIPVVVAPDDKAHSTIFSLGGALFHTFNTASSERFHQIIGLRAGDYGDRLGLRTIWPTARDNFAAMVQPFDDVRIMTINDFLAR